MAQSHGTRSMSLTLRRALLGVFATVATEKLPIYRLAARQYQDMPASGRSCETRRGSLPVLGMVLGIAEYAIDADHGRAGTPVP
jgi:hypothetical protein